MMSSFLALHELAARRGEGLRPELLRLLERSRIQSGDGQADGSRDITESHFAPELATPTPPR